MSLELNPVFEGSGLQLGPVFDVTGVPAIGTVTPGDTSLVFTYTGPVTHYRVFPLAGSPGSWVSIGASPVTVTGLTANTEYTLQISGDGSTVDDSEGFGTNNPGTGGGEFPTSVENDLALAYTVLGSASADRALAYTVIGAVSSDRALAYSVLGSASADRTLAYSVLGSAQQDLAFAYNVFNAVSADRSLAYSVLGFVSADRTLTYTVLGSAQQDLALSYQIEESGVVVADLTINYGIGGAVSQDLTLSYGVLGAAQQDLALSYSVLGAAQQDLAFAYQVIASVVADRTLAYAVIGSVERDLGLEWMIFSGSGGGADPAEVWAHVLEGGLSAEQMLRVILAAVSGRTEGIGTSTERYFSRDGSKPRITATFDSNGNRAAVVIDGSP